MQFWETAYTSAEIQFENLPGEWIFVGTDLCEWSDRIHEPTLRCIFRRPDHEGRPIPKLIGDPQIRHAPVGWVPKLRMGSLWIDGYCVGLPHPLDPQRFNLNVDHSAIQFLEAGKKLGTVEVQDSAGRPSRRSYYLIPPYSFSFRGLGEKFSLVALPRGSDPFGIIVPSFVLSQFYAGASSRLAQALYSGRWSQLYDHSETRFIDDAGTFQISPLYDLSNDDYAIVARYAAGRHGGPERRGLARTYWSQVRAKFNRRPPIPTALPPFEGETRWDVEGVWIGANARYGTPGRFLVLWINNCSAQFPFSALTIIRDHVELQPPTGPVATLPVKRTPLPDQVGLISHERPDSKLAPLTDQVAAAASRFSALQTIPVRVIKRETTRARTHNVVPTPGTPSDLGSTAPGLAEGTNVHPVKFEHRTASEKSQEVPNPPQEPPPSQIQKGGCAHGVDTYVDILNLLKGIEGLQVSTRCLSKTTRHYRDWEFGLVPSTPGRSWHLRGVVDPGEKGPRTRLLMISRLEFEPGRGQSAYLIDLEPKVNEQVGAMMLVIPPKGLELNEVQLGKIVRVIREGNCLWSEKSDNQRTRAAIMYTRAHMCPETHFESVQHRRHEPADYVEQILGRLQRDDRGGQVTKEPVGEGNQPAVAPIWKSDLPARA